VAIVFFPLEVGMAFVSLPLEGGVAFLSLPLQGGGWEGDGIEK
jgi:hypothetical protein